MRNLDDIKIIERLDKLKMREVIAGLPAHAQKAFQIGKGFSLSPNFAEVKNVVFCGMGGSAIGAEIVSFYLRKEINHPVLVNRDYSLPQFVNCETLVVLTSYSGNTEETLSAYEQAQEQGAKIVSITSGGQLGDLAKKHGHPSVPIPTGLPPRGALAFLCFPILALFAKIGLIKDKEDEVKETISVLERLENDSLGIAVPIKSNPAKQLAGEVFDNFCVIYAGGELLSGVVTRWRGQFAENSKMLTSCHVLPEMNHNEIVGWQHPSKLLKKFASIFLRDKQDHPQVKKRIEISKEILEKEGIKVKEVYSQGTSLLARTFSLIYLGDFTSLYLAILNGEDPTPVKRIDYLKKRLKEL